MFLVTGGAGFIGSHTVRQLLQQGHAVRVLDNLSTGSRSNLEGLDVELMVGSIERDADVERALVGVERVIHLAARISVPESVGDPLAYDLTNVHGHLRVLTLAAEAGVRRVVYASSCAVYGSVPGLPKREESPLAPESPYAASKAANELYAAAVQASMGLEAVGLRYFNVFGRGQDPSGPYGAVIPLFASWALAGKPLLVHGDGEQGRDFVHVSDVARANVLAAVAPEVAGGVFNIGGGRMTTVNQVAAAIRVVVGDQVVVEHGPARAGDVRLSMADISAASTWGWRPTVDFDQALLDTVAWFKAS